MSNDLGESNENKLNDNSSSLKQKMKRRLLPRTIVDPAYATSPCRSKRSESPEFSFDLREDDIWDVPSTTYTFERSKKPSPVIVGTPTQDRKSTRHVQSRPSSLTERLLKLANKQENFDLTPHVVVPANLEEIFKRADAGRHAQHDSISDASSFIYEESDTESSPKVNAKLPLPPTKFKVINRKFLQDDVEVVISKAETDNLFASPHSAAYVVKSNNPATIKEEKEEIQTGRSTSTIIKEEEEEEDIYTDESHQHVDKQHKSADYAGQKAINDIETQDNNQQDTSTQTPVIREDISNQQDSVIMQINDSTQAIDYQPPNGRSDRTMDTTGTHILDKEHQCRDGATEMHTDSKIAQEHDDEHFQIPVPEQILLKVARQRMPTPLETKLARYRSRKARLILKLKLAGLYSSSKARYRLARMRRLKEKDIWKLT